ncbi:MAG: autotransporter domain-containing protein, partial [Candidatus Omnitrophica bacterium]|nr:autotransporter domain-containing protein [Candidatus Omnitrophota bacterium]
YLKAINIIGGGTLTMANNMDAATIAVASGSGITLSGNQSMPHANLTLANGAALMLGTNTLTMNQGGLLTASLGSQIYIDAASYLVYGNIQQSGNASVAAGTKVFVNETGYIPNGKVLTVVNGAGGSGVLPGVIVTDNDIINTFVPNTVAGPDLTLTVSANYNPGNLDSNTQQVANTLQAMEAANDVHEDMATVLAELHNLPDAAAVSRAVSQFKPAQGAQLIDQSFGMMDGGIEAVAAHLGEVRTASLIRSQGIRDRLDAVNASLDRFEAVEGMSSGEYWTDKEYWAKGLGTQAVQRKAAGVPGYKTVSTGIILGMDILRTDMGVLGLASGYAFSGTDSDEFNIGQTKIMHFPLAAYLDINQQGPWHVNSSLSMAWNVYTASRTISFGSINRLATAHYNGQEFSFYNEASYDISMKPFTLTPSMFLDYSHLRINQYEESGAGDLDLKVSQQNYDRLAPGLGMSVAGAWKLEELVLRPKIRFKWAYDLMADRAVMSSAFTGGGPAFQTTGPRPARSSFGLGTGLGIDLPNDQSLQFDYDAEMRQNYFASNISAMFKSKF